MNVRKRGLLPIMKNQRKKLQDLLWRVSKREKLEKVVKNTVPPPPTHTHTHTYTHTQNNN